MTIKPQMIRGPFQGVVSDLVAPQGPLTDFDDVLNFFVRKGRAQSRPRLNVYLAEATGNPKIRTMGSFKDQNGVLHTYFLVNYLPGQTPAYMLSPGPVLNPLLIPGLTTGQNGSSLPFAVGSIQNQVYFANGGYPLAYLDGSNTVQFAGNTPGTCRFLAVNVSHLIQAYCTEPASGIALATDYPRRVRWSATNNPQQWDPLADFTAGFNDILDVPDDITGLCTSGRNTWVWRTNGLTVMFPTGVALAAFGFENYSVSEDGIGNVFPYALSTFGNQTVCISNYDVHSFDGTAFTGIGGPNRKKIFNDLADAAGDFVWGRILPNFTLGYDFLCYMLTIPGPNVTWIYTFDDGQWVRFSSSSGYLTAARTVYTS